MATTFSLIKAATTLALNGGTTYTLLSYKPSSLLGVDDVTESARVLVQTASVAAMQAAIRDIETLLMVDAPRRADTGAGDRVYLKFQPDGASEAYRSEILRGKIDYQDDAMTSPGWVTKRQVEIAIAITRKSWWESDTEYQIPLTNGNATNNTTGLTIKNHDDGDTGDDSFVAIAAVDVGGNMSAPARVEMTNTHASRSIKKLHIGHLGYGDVSVFAHVLEAESATLNATYAASAADATCSNGNKATLTAVPTSEAYMMYWTLNTAQLNALLDGYFKVLVRLSTLPTTATMQMRIKVEVGSTVIYDGAYQTLSQTESIQVLATPRLKPYLIGLTGAYQMTIKIYAKDSGSGNAAIDFISLIPMEGYRYIEAAGGENISPNVVAVDDGIEGAVYANWLSPGGKSGQFVGRGGGIMLRPNANQRLYFLHSISDGTAPIDTTMTVKAYYRKRVAST